MRAALYLRMSFDRAGEELGIDRQREAGRKLCEIRDWPTPVEYVDNSVTAAKHRGAGTAYDRLLQDARKGAIGAVVVWDVDRLTRTPREIEDWIDLAESHGVRLVTLDGEVDTASENGRLFLRIKADVARYEIEHKAKRQRAANAQRRAAGHPPGGKRAFGWERDGVTLVEAEAAAVRAGAERLLKGGSLRSVAAAWTAGGHVTADGGPWRPYAVRSLMLNPRTAGLVARGVGRDQWEVEADSPAGWPALLEEGDWRGVGAVLRDPARRTTPGTARVHLLSGLALCGVCGAPVMAGGTTARVQTYRCSVGRGAGHGWSRARAPIDDFVTRVITGRLARPDAADLLAADVRAERAEVDRQVAGLRARIGELVELVTDGVLTAAEFRQKAPRLREELAVAEQQQADLARGDALAGLAGAVDAAEQWQAIDLDWKRLVIDALAQVRLHPPGRGARVFDPSTVEVAWRHG